MRECHAGHGLEVNGPCHFLKFTKGLEIFRVVIEHKPEKLIHYMEKNSGLSFPHCCYAE